MPGGRPTTYKKEYCALVSKHLGEGLSLESFGALVDTHKDTIYEWQAKHPEFSDAIKDGRSKQALFWERMGRDIVSGVNKKLENANITAFIWMTKNMLKWRDKTEVDHLGIPDSKPVIIKINMPKKNEVK